MLCSTIIECRCAFSSIGDGEKGYCSKTVKTMVSAFWWKALRQASQCLIKHLKHHFWFLFETRSWVFFTFRAKPSRSRIQTFWETEKLLWQWREQSSPCPWSRSVQGTSQTRSMDGGSTGLEAPQFSWHFSFQSSAVWYFPSVLSIKNSIYYFLARKQLSICIMWDIFIPLAILLLYLKLLTFLRVRIIYYKW